MLTKQAIKKLGMIRHMQKEAGWVGKGRKLVGNAFTDYKNAFTGAGAGEIKSELKSSMGRVHNAEKQYRNIQDRYIKEIQERPLTSLSLSAKNYPQYKARLELADQAGDAQERWRVLKNAAAPFIKKKQSRLSDIRRKQALTIGGTVGTLGTAAYGGKKLYDKYNKG